LIYLDSACRRNDESGFFEVLLKKDLVTPAKASAQSSIIANVLMTIFAVFKLKCLKITTQSNSFALGAKFVIKEKRIACDALQRLRATA